MTEEEATVETKRLFGEDSFTEYDDAGGIDRYYIGALPISPGAYIGFMGFSWAQAVELAKASIVDSPVFGRVSPADNK